MVKTNFFNPGLNTSDTYTGVWIQEKVTVRDEKELSVKKRVDDA